MLPFDCIDDPERSAMVCKTWENARERLEDAASNYRTAWWDRADPVVEVWAEKVAVAGILQDLAVDKYGVLFVAGLRFNSLTFLHEAAQRFAARPGGTTIIYVGDHDPSGLDMDRDNVDRLAKLEETLKADLSVSLVRVALTLKQIEEHALPPQLTKKTDSRAGGYDYDGSWELDALPAAVLYEVVESEIRKRLPYDFEDRLQDDALGRSRIWSMVAGA